MYDWGVSLPYCWIFFWNPTDPPFQTFDFQNPHVVKHGLILQLRNVNKITISPLKNSNQCISIELQTSGAHWVLFNMLGTFLGAITGGTTIFPIVRPLQPAPSLSKSGTNGWGGFQSMGKISHGDNSRLEPLPKMIHLIGQKMQLKIQSMFE